MMCHLVVVGHRSNTECIDGSFVVKRLDLANDSYITVFFDAVLIPVSSQNVRFFVTNGTMNCLTRTNFTECLISELH